MAFLSRVSSTSLMSLNKFPIVCDRLVIPYSLKKVTWNLRNDHQCLSVPKKNLSTSGYMGFKFEILVPTSHNKKLPKSSSGFHAAAEEDLLYPLDKDNLIQVSVESNDDITEIFDKISVATKNAKNKNNSWTSTEITKRTKGPFTREDDELILEYVMKYGDDFKTFKMLKEELGRSLVKGIINRYKRVLSNASSIAKQRKSFNHEEDKLILEYVNKYGDQYFVFKCLAAKLNRTLWLNVRARYYRIKSNPSNAEGEDRQSKRPFSKEEDELILDYVNQFGKTINAFNRLAHELHRNINSVRARYRLITSNVSINGPKEWTLTDDKVLIEFILKVSNKE